MHLGRRQAFLFVVSVAENKGALFHIGLSFVSIDRRRTALEADILLLHPTSKLSFLLASVRLTCVLVHWISAVHIPHVQISPPLQDALRNKLLLKQYYYGIEVLNVHILR